MRFSREMAVPAISLLSLSPIAASAQETRQERDVSVGLLERQRHRDDGRPFGERRFSRVADGPEIALSPDMRFVQLKMLLVDDDPAVLRALGRQLQGHSLRFAMDATGALQELDAEAPDVVICDYRLPDGDGVALLEGVRRLFPGVRRVLMSADPPDYLRQILMAGVVEHFLPKPLRRTSEREIMELVLGPQASTHRSRGSARLKPVAADDLN